MYHCCFEGAELKQNLCKQDMGKMPGQNKRQRILTDLFQGIVTGKLSGSSSSTKNLLFVMTDEGGGA